jgi:hypothetical protein
MKTKLLFIAIFVTIIACGRTAPRRLELYPSPTVLPTQTERVVIYTTTPLSTYTSIVKEVTSTPKPEYLCIVADEAVYLRPSASMDNYPISPLPNGARVLRLGGEKEDWIFVEYGEFSGWIRQEYLKNCK